MLGTEEEKRQIPSFFNSPCPKIRMAAFRCVGQPGNDWMVESLMKAYKSQNEAMKRIILESLYKINGKNYINIFCQSYAETSSSHTKRTALNFLWNLGVEGKEAFNRLKLNAPEEEQILFKHAQNIIISMGGGNII